MKVPVLLFAGLADGIGGDRVEIEWSGGTAVELLRRIAEERPELAARLGACRVAVNHAFVEGAEPVPVEAEIALIPPVAGG